MNIFQASPILIVPPDKWAAAFGQTPVGNDSPLTIPPSGAEMHERLDGILKGEGFSLDKFSRHVFAAKNPALFSDPSFPIRELVSQRASLLEQGHPVQHDDFVVEPLDQLAIQHLIRNWGWKDIPTDGLAGFLSQIAIEPNETLRIFEDYAFETIVHHPVFGGPVNLEPLHHLARLFQTPLTLARYLLADYANKIPPDLWDSTAQLFGRTDMKEVSKNVATLLPDTETAVQFFYRLLDRIADQHRGRERRRTAWSHFWKKGPSWKEKRARLAALAVKVLAALTLETKYGKGDQEKLLGLRGRFKKMSAAEIADTVETLRNFFYQLLETMDRHPATRTVFPYTRKELEEGRTGPSAAKIGALIPRKARLQVEKLNALRQQTVFWQRTSRIDFRAHREILDAFFGVAGGNCTAKAGFVTYALSDPAFQPVRILVDGEFAGSFMTYSTTFGFKETGPIGHLGAHDIGACAVTTDQRVLIVSGIDSRARFEPESFVHNLFKYLRKIAENGQYDLVLLPKYEGSQSSHDVSLRKELQRGAPLGLRVEQPVYYPKRGPGNDPETDFHPHSTSKNGYWVLFQNVSA